MSSRLVKAALMLCSLPFFILVPWEVWIPETTEAIRQATITIVVTLYTIGILANATNENLLDMLSPFGAFVAGFIPPFVFLWYELCRGTRETFKYEIANIIEGRENVFDTIEVCRHPCNGDKISSKYAECRILYVKYQENKIPRIIVERDV